MIKKAIKVHARIKKSQNLRNEEVYHISSKNAEQEIILKTNKNTDFGFYKNSTLKYKFSSIVNQNSSQSRVFKEIAEPVIKKVLQGYNGTIFAYGQTGSGKTYTITGAPNNYENRGIIPRAIQYVFDYLNKNESSIFTVYISYMEIYNESGYDLLNPKHAATEMEHLPKIILLEDSQGELHLRNLSVVPVATEKEAMQLMFLGDTNRAIAETPMNLYSSRSHCIFTLHIVNSAIVGGSVRAKLHLVDLAGSERMKKTNPYGKLFGNARQINLSLHYLEQVIIALSEGKKHIPYRNSTMTTVLKDSLGGNCMTVMIANLSMESTNFPETISTCKFAQRVALVCTEVSVNEENNPYQQIAVLKMEIDNLKRQLETYKGFKTNDKLSPDEINVCKTKLMKYIDNETNDLMTDGDMRKMQMYFQLLKNMIHSKQKHPNEYLDSKKLKSITEKYEEILKQKDEHISNLTSTLNKKQYSESSHNLTRKSVATDTKSENECKNIVYDMKNHDLESYVVLLKQKYCEAQNVTNNIEVCKHNIVLIKSQLDEISHQNSTYSQKLIAHLKTQQEIYRTNVLKMQEIKNETVYLNHGYEQAKIRYLNKIRENQGEVDPFAENTFHEAAYGDGLFADHNWGLTVRNPALISPALPAWNYIPNQNTFGACLPNFIGPFLNDHAALRNGFLVPAVSQKTPVAGHVGRNASAQVEQPYAGQRCFGCAHYDSGPRADRTPDAPATKYRENAADYCLPERLERSQAKKVDEVHGMEQDIKSVTDGDKTSGFLPETRFERNEQVQNNLIEQLRDIPLTGDPEVDEEIIAFYKAKLNVV